LASGVTLRVRATVAPVMLILASGRRPWLEEVAVRSRLPGGLSGSLAVNGMALVTFRSTDWGPRPPSTGGSLTGVMVTWKVWVTLEFSVPPSLTVTLMVTTPLALGAGVNVSTPEAAGLV
jgi:hypothetical protein